MVMRKTKQIERSYHSYGSGITCIASPETDDDAAPRYFASRRADSPHYDQTLAQLTSALHDLLRQAYAARLDEKTRIGLLVTSHGLLPVWKFEYTDMELPAGVAGEGAVLLDEKSDAEVAALLGLDTRHGAGSALPSDAAGRIRKFFLAEPTGDGGVDCVHPGNSCLIDLLLPSLAGAPRYFASQRSDAPNYDALLGTLSDQLNAVVEQAHLARTDGHARVGLLLTHRGLLPVWKRPGTPAQDSVSMARTLDTMSDDEVTALLHLA